MEKEQGIHSSSSHWNKNMTQKYDGKKRCLLDGVIEEDGGDDLRRGLWGEVDLLFIR